MPFPNRRNIPDRMGETHCIFHRHTGTLRHVLRHGMRSISKQRDPAVDPVLYRLAITQDPQPPVAAVLNNLLCPFVDVSKTLHHDVEADWLARDRFGRIVMQGGDEIEDLPI
jgi:hypothetical protein